MVFPLVETEMRGEKKDGDKEEEEEETTDKG